MATLGLNKRRQWGDSKRLQRRLLVTGGAGYVGGRLVPELLRLGYYVRVLDRFLFGESALASVRSSSNLDVLSGDIRDESLVKQALDGIDVVIHLAAIANDPSAALDPELTRAVNYEAVLLLVDTARRHGVKRFINACTATVYGVKAEGDITEDASLDPISLYARYKAESEAYVLASNSPEFETVSLRAATVCGYSPRQRLDLTVNILTRQAVVDGQITVHGGNQVRPNIHIADLVRAYIAVLEAPTQKFAGQVYNVGFENHRVIDIADQVRRTLGRPVPVLVQPIADRRSYRINSDKIKRELGFSPQSTVEAAVRELAVAFGRGLIPDPTHPRYYNVLTMKESGFH